MTHSPFPLNTQISPLVQHIKHLEVTFCPHNPMASFPRVRIVMHSLHINTHTYTHSAGHKYIHLPYVASHTNTYIHCLSSPPWTGTYEWMTYRYGIVIRTMVPYLDKHSCLIGIWSLPWTTIHNHKNSRETSIHNKHKTTVKETNHEYFLVCFDYSPIHRTTLVLASRFTLQTINPHHRFYHFGDD